MLSAHFRIIRRLLIIETTGHTHEFPLNFIGGEKGGVGKSVTARVLAQYFIDKGRLFHRVSTPTARTPPSPALCRLRLAGDRRYP